MKKLFISFAMLLAAGSTFAQVTVSEPEFINSYCILTSDSTLAILPKESGSIQKHENKAKKWTKIIGGAADVVGAVGMVGAYTSGSLSGAVTGIRAAGTKSSAYTVTRDGKDARLLIKGENNEQDPMELYRIVRFKASKKDRRIQWMEFQPALIGTKETQKAGYVGFTGHKYGEQSYLLTIPAAELEKGEYGIFYMSIISATAIPVGTFSVK